MRTRCSQWTAVLLVIVAAAALAGISAQEAPAVPAHVQIEMADRLVGGIVGRARG